MRSLQGEIERCRKMQWILGAAILVLAAGFLLLGYRPASAHLTALEAEIESAKRELEENQLRVADLPAVEREVERLRRRLERFDKRLPKSSDLSEFVSQITHLGYRSALTGVRVEPQTVNRGEHFSIIPIRMIFEGEFVEVFDFLKQVEEMPRLTRVRELEVEGQGSRTGKVKVQLVMNIYFLED